LRCNACGEEQVPAKNVVRVTPEAVSSVIVQRALGMPLNRLSRLQGLYGIPVAASTLWSMAEEGWHQVGSAVLGALYRYAQEGTIYGGDDTTARILEVQKRFKAGEDIRKGCYTSNVCTQVGEHKIVLYFTGNKYLSENLSTLLKEKEDGAIVSLMIDGSSNSLPKLLWVVVAYCLVHGRRKFVELLSAYPKECEYFLGEIAKIYRNDKETIKSKMNENKRMHYHRENSLPILRGMYRMMIHLFRIKQVEPNSGLGKAFIYWLKRRYGLSAFTRIPGMPLDNNGVEQKLRVMAMARKTSLFFMTLASAGIWSGLFSLVYTCEANGINAFAYLTWLQKNARAVNREPEKYLPWHFRIETERIAA
jgi:hypothetical protein